MLVERNPYMIDPIFVVPAGITFTTNQIRTMAEFGQQPGVPFHLNQDGAQRPQGSRIKIKPSKMKIAIKTESIKLIFDKNNNNKNKVNISFNYDSTTIAEVQIFIFAIEKLNPKEIK
jgi:hypothetical protein